MPIKFGDDKNLFDMSNPVGYSGAYPNIVENTSGISTKWYEVSEIIKNNAFTVVYNPKENSSSVVFGYVASNDKQTLEFRAGILNTAAATIETDNVYVILSSATHFKNMLNYKYVRFYFLNYSKINHVGVYLGNLPNQKFTKSGGNIRPMYKAKRVNLFDPKAGYQIGAWSAADGNVTEKPSDVASLSNSRIEVITASAWRGYASGFIEVKPNTTYRVSYDRSETPAVYFAVSEYDENCAFLRSSGNSTNPTHRTLSFKTHASAKYIRIIFEHGTQADVTGNMIIKDIELHEGSTEITFEKFKNYLPAGYREVEYIESTGTQKIDTGYTVGLGERWYSIIDVEYTEKTSASQVLLCTGTSDGSWLGQNGEMFSIGGSDGKFYDSATRRSIRSTWGNAPETTVDSIRRYYLDTINTKAGNVSLFASSNASNPYYSKARVYSCQIMNSNRVVVRNYVPCIRISDEQAGLYDTINKTFITDTNGGNFIAGKVITDSISKVYRGKDLVYSDKFHGYTRLESITSTRGAETIRVPFYMNHKYITDIQFSNDTNEMSTTHRILRPHNVGSTYGGIYWEADFSTSSDQVNGLIAAGGGNRIPATSAKAIERNKVLWYFDTAEKRTYVTVNGAQISRAPGSANIPEGDEVRGIVDNVENYVGKQTIYRETEYNADMTKVLHDFVPVMRNGDGRLGFYDMITDKFHCSSSNAGLTGYPDPNYTFVSYLQSSGTEYIDTGVIANQDTKLTMDMEFLNEINEESPFGAYESSSKFLWNFSWSTYSYPMYGVTADSINHTLSINTRYALELSKNGAFIDGTRVKSYTAQTFQMTGSINLFRRNPVSGTTNPRMATIKMYGCKIYQGDTIAHEYLPAVRKSDSVAGLYDTVTGTFLTNAGTGTFTY